MTPTRGVAGGPKPPSTSRRRRLAFELALIGVTVIWGATFVVVKEAIARIPPYSFNTLRFALATAALAACCLPALRRLGRKRLGHGMVLGVFLFGGYAFQTVGLAHTEASRAGFITGMFVVFTPLLSALVLRRRPDHKGGPDAPLRTPGPAALTGVVFATAGLALLSLRGSFVPGFGDLLVLACALSFAAHIVGLGAWSPGAPALPLATVQVATAALLHGAVALVVELPTTTYQLDAPVLGALLLTGILASAAAFWVQTAAQRVVSPTRTAIVLTFEPVFAGLAGFVLLGERLSARGWLGCALILAGMVVTEAWPRDSGSLPGSTSTSTALNAASLYSPE